MQTLYYFYYCVIYMQSLCIPYYVVLYMQTSCYSLLVGDLYANIGTHAALPDASPANIPPALLVFTVLHECMFRMYVFNCIVIPFFLSAVGIV